ncbi:MAG: hypothetical protein ACI8RD_001278 [Bacillariaceae sp.]|jgi:hypothetical protein
MFQTLLIIHRFLEFTGRMAECVCRHRDRKTGKSPSKSKRVSKSKRGSALSVNGKGGGLNELMPRTFAKLTVPDSTVVVLCIDIKYMVAIRLFICAFIIRHCDYLISHKPIPTIIFERKKKNLKEKYTKWRLKMSKR